MLAAFKFSLLGISILTVLSLIPGNQLPESPIQYVDIMVHVLMYSVVGFVLLSETGKQYESLSVRSEIGILLLLVVYSGIIELMQENLIPGRFGAWSDFVANGVGALSALAVYKRKEK